MHRNENLDLKRTIRKVFKRSSFQESHTYANYEAALKDCSSNAYQNEELCNMIADKTVIYKQELLKEPYVLNPASLILSSSLNYLITNHSLNEVSIADFGGASGAHYYDVRRLIPEAVKLKWIVVETEQMVKSALSRELDSTELSFVNAIESLEDSVDLVYSSSTLQYVPEPYKTLEKLLNLRPKWALFNRMVFNLGDSDVVTIQSSSMSDNGPGKMPQNYTDKKILYPHTLISLGKFKQQMETSGYRQQWSVEEYSGMIGRRDGTTIGLATLYKSQKQL